MDKAVGINIRPVLEPEPEVAPERELPSSSTFIIPEPLRSVDVFRRLARQQREKREAQQVRDKVYGAMMKVINRLPPPPPQQPPQQYRPQPIGETYEQKVRRQERLRAVRMRREARARALMFNYASSGTYI